jgi:hypothetical protein
MRHEFPTVEKEWYAVSAKCAFQRFVIAIETAHEYGGIAEAVAGAVVMDEFQNFARGENGLCLGIGAGGKADGIRRSAGLRSGALEFRL